LSRGGRVVTGGPVSVRMQFVGVELFVARVGVPRNAASGQHGARRRPRPVARVVVPMR
jgi:hypothetical protein